MNILTHARLLHLALLICVTAVFAGQLLGQPVLLGYVTSGSMEPTMAAGDGFVAVPAAVSGEIRPGDIVVYESPDEGLTTHRVVEETDAGYVTRGDANQVTDQARGDPHVTDGDIAATVLQVDDTVPTVPGLGTVAAPVSTAFEAVQLQVSARLGGGTDGRSGLAALLFGLSLAGYVVETLRKHDSTTDSGDARHRVPPRYQVAGFVAVVVILASAAMIVPAGQTSLTVISSDPAPDAAGVAAPGGTAETTYRVSNDGFVPVVTYLDAGDGVALDRESVGVDGREAVDIRAELAAPEMSGQYERSVTEWRYLYVLPRPVLDDLYGIHPWLPLLAILGPLGTGAWLLGRGVAGRGPPRAARKRIRKRTRT